MEFASDNTAAIAPPVLEAMIRANDGFALGYGADAVTERLSGLFGEFFGRDCAFFLVPTGTAANALALAHASPPWGAVFCHANAHVATDECGAPEFFGGGLKLVTLAGDDGKLQAETVAQQLETGGYGRVHRVTPSVLSISQASEAGTVYRPDEIRALADLAHRHHMRLHMDGARLVNALANLDCHAAEVTWRAGVDILSFGATKAGAMAAEAVVVFDPALVEGLAERRKRAGHLVSKHRFVAAQFEGFLEHNAWKPLSAHANAMAKRLGDGLTARGVRLLWPVEANIVFALLPPEVHQRWQMAGARYYVRPPSGLPAGMVPPAGYLLARLVTSFATVPDEVDRLLGLLQPEAAGLRP